MFFGPPPSFECRLHAVDSNILCFYSEDDSWMILFYQNQISRSSFEYAENFSVFVVVVDKSMPIRPLLYAHVGKQEILASFWKTWPPVHTGAVINDYCLLMAISFRCIGSANGQQSTQQYISWLHYYFVFLLMELHLNLVLYLLKCCTGITFTSFPESFCNLD